MSILRSLGVSAAVVLMTCGCGSDSEAVSAVIRGGMDSGLGPANDGQNEAGSGGGLVDGPDSQIVRSDAGADGALTPINVVPLDPNDPLNGGKPPAPGGPGCGKIDFLFVIDNSGSMSDEQANLIRSFPGFIDTIRTSVAASDHHIMVVDTDASGAAGSSGSSCSGNSCTCTPSPSCCQNICATRPSGTCNGAPCSNPGQVLVCDGRLGAGRVKDASERRCVPDSPRFVTSGAADLTTKFSCMARVGTAGDGNERPMQAIAEAIGPLNRAGACNQGFLRDDAILVVTFITDEEDSGKSPGGPREWIDTLAAAKGGNREAVVVLGVFGDSDRPGSVCAPGGLVGNIGADPGPRLRELVQGFKYGVAGSVCSADYTPFFQQAVQVIDSACDGFTR